MSVEGCLEPAEGSVSCAWSGNEARVVFAHCRDEVVGLLEVVLGLHLLPGGIEMGPPISPGKRVSGRDQWNWGAF